MSTLPLLYGPYACWFHLLTAPDEYAEEAMVIHALLAAHCDGKPRRVLELGSGGGNLASNLTAHYEMTLTDVSPSMLAMSESINPGARHVVGDMRTLRLEETFDAVIIHDAIGYMTTEADLRAAIVTAYQHLRVGGALIVLPDFVTETFEAGIESGGTDDDDGRGARFLAWQWDTDPSDTVVEVVYAYILREADGTTTTVEDAHSIGLYPRATWLAVLEQPGFDVEVVSASWWEDVYLARRTGM